MKKPGLKPGCLGVFSTLRAGDGGALFVCRSETGSPAVSLLEECGPTFLKTAAVYIHQLFRAPSQSHLGCVFPLVSLAIVIVVVIIITAIHIHLV
jgi:hypothetical protein